MRRSVAYGANLEAMPVTKFALKAFVPSALVEPFECDGSRLDRLVMWRPRANRH